MFIRQGISIGNLLLDTENYRIIKQNSQKGARDAIIAEQGSKLTKLAEDILKNGLNPFDLPMVIDAEDGNQNFIVVEGNRRVTAILLLLNPELAKDTKIHAAFVRLSQKYPDSIPKVLDCVIAPNKKSSLVWINRKHANGLEGAGTEHWTAMAKARADVEQGIKRPELQVINFILENATINPALRKHLEGAKFNLTTLERLITTTELQDAAGLEIAADELISIYDKDWATSLFTDLLTIITDGKFGEEKFTERNIDTQQKREMFVHDLMLKHPGKKVAESPWVVTGKPSNSSLPPPKPKQRQPKPTPSTEDQPNLVPKKIKLQLPAGKINDIFDELKKLDVISYRHSASVLLRVFIELTVDSFLKAHNSMPTKKQSDTLLDKLNLSISFIETNKIMTDKELNPLKTELKDKNSFISPVTLNAYVHSEWMNPDPTRLKITWNNAQLFVQRMWESVKNAGQP